MDFQNLISCIKCHREERNLELIKESLKSIVTICTQEKTGKDAFREVSGLDFIIDLLLNTDELVIVEYCLNVLAFIIDGNIPNQMLLTNEKVFRILQAIFEKKTYPNKVLKNAIVLFSTILFQNKIAQDLAYQSEILQLVINLYELFFPECIDYNNSEYSDRLELWLDINRSLCFAMNNPLNEKNQELCSVLFPMALKLIEISVNSEIIEAASVFLSMSISNNIKNQDTFTKHDGLLIVKQSLNKTFKQIDTPCLNECSNITNEKSLLLINNLLSVINDSVLDHEENAALCGKLGIVSMLAKFLSIEFINISVLKNILLALGYCIDACKENRFIILDVSNFDTFLKKNLVSNDPELQTAVRYLLQVCLDEPVINQEEVDCLDIKLPKNDSKLTFSPNKNSTFPKNLRIDTELSCNNATDESGSDSSKTVLNSPAFLTTFQEATNFEKCMDFSLENNIYNSERQNHDRDLFRLKSDNSDSDSDLSLQSAGHFYRTHTMKCKDNENKCKSYLKGNKSTNSRQSFLLDDGSFYGRNSSKTFEAKTTSMKLENCKRKETMLQNPVRQKNPCVRSVNKHKKNSERTKSDKSKNSIFSLKNYDTGNNSVNSKNKENVYSPNLNKPEKNNLETKILDSGNHEIVENIESNTLLKENFLENSLSNKYTLAETVKNITPSISNTPAVVDKGKSSSNPGILSEKDTNHQELRKTSNKFHTFKLKHFSGISKNHKSKSQLPPGCVEVIVLPGTVCCEHKLSSMTELLKVCSIEDD